MGSSHSSSESHVASDDRGEEDGEEGDKHAPAGAAGAVSGPEPGGLNHRAKEQVLEQEPELLPCRAAASPFSPQPYATSTPRLLLELLNKLLVNMS